MSGPYTVAYSPSINVPFANATNSHNPLFFSSNQGAVTGCIGPKTNVLSAEASGPKPPVVNQIFSFKKGGKKGTRKYKGGLGSRAAPWPYLSNTYGIAPNPGVIEQQVPYSSMYAPIVAFDNTVIAKNPDRYAGMQLLPKMRNCYKGGKKGTRKYKGGLGSGAAPWPYLSNTYGIAPNPGVTEQQVPYSSMYAPIVAFDNTVIAKNPDRYAGMQLLPKMRNCYKGGKKLDLNSQTYYSLEQGPPLLTNYPEYHLKYKNLWCQNAGKKKKIRNGKKSLKILKKTSGLSKKKFEKHRKVSKTRRNKMHGGWILEPGYSSSCSNLDAAASLNNSYIKFNNSNKLPKTSKKYMQLGGDERKTLCENSNYYSAGGRSRKCFSGNRSGGGIQYSLNYPSIGNAHYPSIGSPRPGVWTNKCNNLNKTSPLSEVSYNLYKDYAFAGNGGKSKKKTSKGKKNKKYKQKGGVLGGSSGNILFHTPYQVAYATGPAPYLTMADKLQLGSNSPKPFNSCLPRVQGA